MPPCLTLSNKGWFGGKALRHTDVMSRGCTCTLSRLTSLETGDRLLPYEYGTLDLPGLEIDRPETCLKDYFHLLKVTQITINIFEDKNTEKSGTPLFCPVLAYSAKFVL